MFKVVHVQKEYIIKKLRLYKQKYQKEGLDIVGIFGSYARDEQDDFSDIDIVYHLDYDKFSKKYKDGFSKLLKINSIKQELEKEFQKRVDFVSDSNNKILKDIIYV